MRRSSCQGSVGMIAGIFFGLMFGFGGIGAALLGYVADLRGIEYVYGVCSFLPLFGLWRCSCPIPASAISSGPLHVAAPGD